MIAAIKNTLDGLLGRGEAAITVPPMDGPLKPNQQIESAEVVSEFSAPADLCHDGRNLWIADGHRILKQSADGTWQEQAKLSGPITAMACLADGGVVVAVRGTELHFLGSRTWKDGPRSVADRPLRCITSLSATKDGGLLVTDSSANHSPEQWSTDLMEHGKSGRVCRLTDSGDGDMELTNAMRFPYGAVERGDQVWVSESWAHRVVAIDAAKHRQGPVLDRLPGYPSRMAPSSDGGVWLTVFTVRTRLVEFVLREREYRQRMMREVDPQFWVAPALSSGKSFLEPLQGGSVKQLGILKPWAPPRSYGLVVKLGADGLPTHSFHSRADGVNHGIVSAVEADGYLYMLSKGAGRLLRVNLKDLSKDGEKA